MSADIFFKTTECLRLDKSTCYQPGDEMYEITHSGLDAQVCLCVAGSRWICIKQFAPPLLTFSALGPEGAWRQGLDLPFLVPTSCG